MTSHYYSTIIFKLNSLANAADVCRQLQTYSQTASHNKALAQPDLIISATSCSISPIATSGPIVANNFKKLC